MSNPVRKDQVSLELQETIEKLETILNQIKTASSPLDVPSAALVKRLVSTSEAIKKSVQKPQPVKRLPWVLISLLVIAAIGVSIYFINLSTITKEVAEITNQEIVKEPLPTVIDNQPTLPPENTPLTIPEEKTPSTIPPENTPSFEEIIPQEKPLINTGLTPEQFFLAGIQQSINSLSNKLQVDLINSVEVDFDNSNLKVKIDPAWYTLSATQQDNLAEDIWKSSQSLAFSKLELVDSLSQIIARSPVVGKKMIILMREKSD